MADLAKIEALAPLGMIQIRADLDRAGDAIAEAAGLAVPGVLGIETDGARWLSWMSPDELLLIAPRDEAEAALAGLRDALTGEHALVEDVSDMRAGFTVTGAGAADVIAKLCPLEAGALGQGTLRRTRAAQVACALWRSAPDQFTVISFRSTADYLRAILEGAASGPAL